MPDAYGNFKGQGWSRAKAAAWERVFAPDDTHTQDCLDRAFCFHAATGGDAECSCRSIHDNSPTDV